MTTPDLGIIGGSGFYEFLDNPEKIDVDTPYGKPSAPVAVGQMAMADGTMRGVAFIPRHGEQHQFPPHKVNYRANMWALRSLGVRQVLAPCAVGSLKEELTPGTFVVPDQVVDRTWGREHTFFDVTGPVAHISFADPYCPRGRAVILAAADAGVPIVDGGTLVVINGPRFSSRAESKWHADAGWSVVGMTGMPEASLAREMGMCFTTVCMVTDHDAGVDAASAVTHAEVLKIFAGNIDRLKGLLCRVIQNLPVAEPDGSESVCECRRILDGMELPIELP